MSTTTMSYRAQDNNDEWLLDENANQQQSVNKQNTSSTITTIAIALLIGCILVLIAAVAILIIRLRMKPKYIYVYGDNDLKNEMIVDIITYNDVYQIDMVQLDETGQLGGGPSRVSQYIKTLKKNKKYPQNMLVLSAGDMISPSLLSTLFNGEQMIEANNIMGLNYSALGNHEFDFGVEILQKRVEQSQFTWINSNVDLPFPTKENVIVQVGPAKIGLFGVLYDFEPTDSRVRIRDVLASAREQVKKLKDGGATFIIALSHLPALDDCELSTVAGIDVIVGGHDHRMKVNADCGDAIYMKATMDWQNIWHAQINFNFSKPIVKYTNIPITAQLPTDPVMEEMIAKYDKAKDNELAVVVGETLVPLDGRAPTMRTNESNLGDYLCDKVAEFLEADIVLMNGGTFRSNKLYLAGTKITKGDIIEILPFSNTATLIRINGSILLQALEHSVGYVAEISGRFPQVSGFRMQYTLAKPRGERIVSMDLKTMNGTFVPITPDMNLKLATNSFMYEGGDGFSMLPHLERLSDPEAEQVLSVIMLEGLKREKTIDQLPENRVVRIDIESETEKLRMDIE
jgi:2',3'-cyclic-nucleotide 2'-phosphodiesterase (5'-nucleotidase family)